MRGFFPFGKLRVRMTSKGKGKGNRQRQGQQAKARATSKGKGKGKCGGLSTPLRSGRDDGVWVTERFASDLVAAATFVCGFIGGWRTLGVKPCKIEEIS